MTQSPSSTLTVWFEPRWRFHGTILSGLLLHHPHLVQERYFLKHHHREWRWSYTGLTKSQNNTFAYRWLSRVSLYWLGAFLNVGFSRPLEKDGMWFISAGLSCHWKKLDLWELPQPRLTNMIAADVERNFYSRCPSNKRPAFIHLLFSDTPLSDSELGKTEFISEEKGDKPGNVEPSKTEETTKKYDESLFKALHRTFFKQIWVSGFLLVVSGKRKKIYISECIGFF